MDVFQKSKSLQFILDALLIQSGLWFVTWKRRVSTQECFLSGVIKMKNTLSLVQLNFVQQIEKLKKEKKRIPTMHEIGLELDICEKSVRTLAQEVENKNYDTGLFSFGIKEKR